MSAISLFAVLAVVTDTLCPQVMAPVEAADVHVRCRVPWRLEWRDAASGEARCLAIDVSHDNIYGDKASVEYVAGTDSVLARWNIDAKDASGPVSLRIAKDLYGTHLYAVNGEELTLDGYGHRFCGGQCNRCTIRQSGTARGGTRSDCISL